MSVHIALIPAAGSGQRLGGPLPKQYQPICGTPMLVHTVRALQTHPAIQHVFIVLSPTDTLFETYCAPLLHHCTPLHVGSTTRAGSVLAGLKAIPDTFADAWIFVHDAARPCLHKKDLSTLLSALNTSDPLASGYVLANPVADTLKRVERTEESATVRVLETVPRDTLWQAQTPQVARCSTLLSALKHALNTHSQPPTDEAQALEWAGHTVQLVAAHHPNFKVTYSADQQLAEAVLSQHSSL